MPAKDPQAQRSARWPVVVLVIATLVVYGRLAGADFSCWDDWANIQHNTRVNPPTLDNFKYYWLHGELGLYVPVTYSVWMGLAQVARVNSPDPNGATLNPWIFHCANLLVHLAGALLTYLLLLRLLRPREGKPDSVQTNRVAAMFGALVWALHPVQVEAVAWISGMKDLLAGCFAIGALWRYVARVQDSDGKANWPGVIATIALLLAMLSKPSAIVVPALAVTIDWLLLGRPFKRALATSAVWVAVAIPFSIIARQVQNVESLEKVPLLLRPMIAGDTLTFYLRKLLVPVNLGLDYGRRPWELIHTPEFKFTWIFSAAAIVIVVLLRRRARWIGAAGLLFLLPIVPVSGLLMFQWQYHSTTADHYLYLPMLGPALAVAFLLRDFNSRPALWSAGVVVGLLAIASFVQAGVWEDDLKLFTHTVQVNPSSFDGHNNLANANLTRGNAAVAIGEFKKAIVCNPTYFLPYQNLAHALSDQGDLNGSVVVLERSLEMRKQVPGALNGDAVRDHMLCGQMLVRLGRIDDAKSHFDAAVKLATNPIEAAKLQAVAREKLDEAAVNNPAASTTRAATQAADRP